MFRMSKKEFGGNKPVFKAIKSPIGPLRLVATDQGLRGLLFAKTTIRSGDTFRLLKEDNGHKVLIRAEHQLREYFAGKRNAFDIPLVLEGTPFQRRVWQLLLEIPYGQTVSYGQIAERLGDFNKARPTGGAVGSNPVGIIVPCHRVIGKDGTLTGFGGGLDVKTYLLKLEGVI